MTWWQGFGVVHQADHGIIGRISRRVRYEQHSRLLLICVGETVYGLAWEINRRLPEREGKWPNFETLMVSKDVFEFEDDAKRDAAGAAGAWEFKPGPGCRAQVMGWRVAPAMTADSGSTSLQG